MSTPTIKITPDGSLSTYRTLRVALVTAGVVLLVSVLLEVLRAGAVPPSVSATFYTPARTVFTGVLLAVALAVVAVKGRPGLENGLLDAAGMLLPLVAFVPTPVVPSFLAPDLSVGLSCTVADSECVPTELVPGVVNNVTSYAIVGAAALVFGWWRIFRRPADRPLPRGDRLSFVSASLVYLGILAWFLLARDSFVLWCHIAAAVTFFLLLIVVVWVNARRQSPAGALGLTSATYRRLYLVVGAVMVIAVLAGVIAFFVLGVDGLGTLIFWVEIVLLVAFIAFWALQTAELWHVTVPHHTP